MTRIFFRFRTIQFHEGQLIYSKYRLVINCKQGGSWQIVNAHKKNNTALLQSLATTYAIRYGIHVQDTLSRQLWKSNGVSKATALTFRLFRKLRWTWPQAWKEILTIMYLNQLAQAVWNGPTRQAAQWSRLPYLYLYLGRSHSRQNLLRCDAIKAWG